jgi:hypothetical protein
VQLSSSSSSTSLLRCSPLVLGGSASLCSDEAVATRHTASTVAGAVEVLHAVRALPIAGAVLASNALHAEEGQQTTGTDQQVAWLRVLVEA